ncbi:MAG: glycosyltransferase [Peptostreptococcaceae bacterium]|nr:glycosyltransferase [Peptostreptococcaceae bacterium]
MNDIFIFSMLAWDAHLLHRSHMLAKYFKKHGKDVYYVEKINSYNPLKLGRYELEKKDVSVLKIYALPYFKGVSKWVFKANDSFIHRAMKDFLKSANISDAAAVISTPHWSVSIGEIENFNNRIFYDISDDYIAFASNGIWKHILEEYEKHAVEISAKVFVTTETLMGKAIAKGLLIENGVDIDSFSSAVKKEYETKGKVIGFIGGLYSWIDYNLIAKVAASHPDDLLVLIGPTDSKGSMDRLSSLENVRYLGPIDKDEIQDYYASFDIGIIPFLSESEYPRLKTVNSNKVYQYLYFGYPVVSTNFNQVDKLRNIVLVSDTHEQFIENINTAKKLGINKGKVDLNAISWETKALEMMKFL